MDFKEIIVDRETFNSGWQKRNICGWCEKETYFTDDWYRSKGNMCVDCITKINSKYIKLMNDEQDKRIEAKKRLLDKLGEKLEEELTEAERQKIVAKMMKLHKQIKYGSRL